MHKTGTIRFEFDTGRPAVEAEFTLEESALPELRSYLSEAFALESLVLGFGSQRVGFGMSAQKGGPVTVTSRELDVLQRAALLHHLRPFVLDDEPFSFFKTRNVIARSSQSEFLKQRLRELKRMFGGFLLQEQMMVTAGDMLVNSEATLRRWLNAFEYHRDRDKAEELEKSLGALPRGMSRPIFFMLLYQKSDAIRYLGQIVFKMVQAWDAADVRDA